LCSLCSIAQAAKDFWSGASGKFRDVSLTSQGTSRWSGTATAQVIATISIREGIALQSFRFIHTGHIHLGSPLKRLSGQLGAAAGRIRTATRVAFDNLMGEAIEDEVGFVIIAGDLATGATIRSASSS
jgi:hypothetical protein